MSYYLFTNENIKDFNTDNIIVGDKISTDKNITSYYIYYNHNNESKEIYLKLSKIRMIFNNFINQKYSQINIPIYPLYNKTENDINFIHNLEQFIKESFNTKYNLRSLLSEKNSLVFLKMSMKNKPKITSTLNNEITFSDFKINGEIELVIKLSYIWFNKTNKTYGLNCQLSQIKYYGLPEQLYIDFIDEPVKTNYIPPPPPMLVKTPEIIFKNSLAQTGINTNISLKKIPSEKELLDALKKLKKINLCSDIF
jgi:hypothetical protein